MMFFRRNTSKDPPASAAPPRHRLEQLVREARDRPLAGASVEAGVASREPDVMALLVELRAAGKRGHESAAARKLGPEFNRYLGAFYNLPPELQAPAIEGLYRSRRLEEEQDLAGAVEACETALESCPNYLPLLDRLAALETASGEKAKAGHWYALLLTELDRLNFYPNVREICRRLIESGVTDLELLERCGRRLEAENDMELAARCWADRAAALVARRDDEEAMLDYDRAILLQPGNAAYRLELALIYERLGEMDRAAVTFDQSESMARDDPETLVRILIIRARIGRPETDTIARLLDMLENRPQACASVLAYCAEAVAESPYNPHLSYIQGVLLAQDGQVEQGAIALRIAVERYSAQADRAAELEVRLALLQLDPRDEDNARRIAELHFERGEVKQAMQVLGNLAKAGRK